MKKNKIISVAIDGPVASGKTSVARKLANRLEILYLNTGAMYRAAGLYVLRHNLDPSNKEHALTFLKQLNVNITYENGKQQTFLNNENVTKLLNNEDVSQAASKISSIDAIRDKMVKLQQKFAKEQSLVIDGRDIGTVVLKDANFKFFMDAKVEERAKRRYEQYLNKGINNLSLEKILKDIKVRDERDTTRKHSPLKKAEDAIYIDTTNKTIEEVVDIMWNYIN